MLFSPSPPPQDNYIPPVPPLPFHARAEPPLRWRVSPDFENVIRPLDVPFPFEGPLHGQRQLPPVRHLSPGPPPAIPGSHDARPRPRPTFGGGIWAFNHNHDLDPTYHPPPAREAQAGGWRNFLNNFGLGAYRRYLIQDGGNPEPAPLGVEDDPDLLEALAFDAEARQQDFPFRLVPRPATNRQAAHLHKADPDYKPTFTHPNSFEPGFSNDFAPRETISVSDEPGPSYVHETGTLLVCARCLDPLVMNVVGPEEEVRKRKLFALHCGHLLDGKCIESLMRPPPILPLDETKEDVDIVASSSKGNQKTGEGAPVDPFVAEKDSVLPQTSAITRGRSSKRNKGKQRAAGLQDEASDERNESGNRKSFQNDYPAVSTAYTRSRLRPRTGEHDVSTPGPTLPAVSITSHPYAIRIVEGHSASLANSENYARRCRSQTRRGRGRGGASRRGRARAKGKEKAESPPPIIEAEYEWSCPVSSCGHKHKSVCIDGMWRMDEQHGAMALYV